MQSLIYAVIGFRSDCESRIRRFLRDERGDSIQWVMGLAIAAVIIAALLVFGKQGLEKLQNFWNQNS